MGVQTFDVTVMGGNSPGKKVPQYLGALAACLFAVSAGTTLGWTAVTISLQGGEQGFVISKNEWSWVGAFLPVGAVLSALPVGALAPVLGRKRLLLLLAPIMLAGWFLLIWANQLWMLMVGRLLNGAVTGAFCIVAPMYTAEISENEVRGILGSYFQFLLVIGVLFVYVLGATVKNVMYINIICAVVPLVAFTVFLFFPDSPRWYLSRGRKSEARKALYFYRGQSYDVDNELSELEAVLDREESEQVSCGNAFTSSAAKKALILSLGIHIFQQLSGINAVIFNSTDLFKDAGDALGPSESTVVVGVFLVSGTYVSTLLVDRLGRRLLLLVSGSVCVICNIALGIYFYLQENKMITSNTGIAMIPIVATSIFMVFFSIGFGPIPWLYMGEVFPSQIKGVAMSIANISNWASVFLVTKYYEGLSDVLKRHGTFWLFGGLLALGCVFVFFMLLETKGKSLEQIQNELAGGRRRSRSLSGRAY